jgi:hypothetical protein
MAAAGYIPPVRITKADLAHSADARAGPATAIFTQNPTTPRRPGLTSSTPTGRAMMTSA